MDAAVRLVREKMVQAHLTLDIVPPARPVHLRADRRALLQVLINLLTNAVKFTAAGRVTLPAGPDEGGGFAYVVADTGIGMTLAPTIGRASCRERVCTYVSSSVVALALQKKRNDQ